MKDLLAKIDGARVLHGSKPAMLIPLSSVPALADDLDAMGDHEAAEWYRGKYVEWMAEANVGPFEIALDPDSA